MTERDGVDPHGGVRVELAVYLRHIIAILIPGREPRQFNAVSEQAIEVSDLSAWSDGELDDLLEEGRRKLDQQAERFDRVRTTAQVTLPVGAALLVVVGSELSSIVREPTTWFRYLLCGLWFIAMILVLGGTLGSAAILAVRASFGTILPSLLTRSEPGEVKRSLAHAYATQSVAGEHTISTRITLQWWSISLLALGGIVSAALWIVGGVRSPV